MSPWFPGGGKMVAVDTFVCMLHVLCVCGSEMPWKFTLFTAVEGRVVEEGAGSTAPLNSIILLRLRHDPHIPTALWNKTHRNHYQGLCGSELEGKRGKWQKCRERERDRDPPMDTAIEGGTGGRDGSLFNLELTFILRPLLSREPVWSTADGHRNTMGRLSTDKKKTEKETEDGNQM